MRVKQAKPGKWKAPERLESFTSTSLSEPLYQISQSLDNLSEGTSPATCATNFAWPPSKSFTSTRALFANCQDEEDHHTPDMPPMIYVREVCRTCREKQVLQWTIPTYTPLDHLCWSFANDHRPSTLMDEFIRSKCIESRF